MSQIWSCSLWKSSAWAFSCITIAGRFASLRGVYRCWRFNLVISCLPLFPLWGYQFCIIRVLVLIRADLFSLIFAPSLFATLVWHFVRHWGCLCYDIKFQLFCRRLFVLSIIVRLLSTFDSESIECRPGWGFDYQRSAFVHFDFILFDFNQVSYLVRGFLIALRFLFELMHQFEDDLITVALS